MAEEFRVLKPLEYYRHFFSEGTRVDGRSLMSTRSIKCEIDAIKTADSSALVKLGNTSVICGCIVGIKHKDNPELDCSDCSGNYITIKVELPPICSNPAGFNNQLAINRPFTTTAYVVPSRQSESAILLTRLLNQIFIDSNCFDIEKLQIGGTNYYWTIEVEVICLNYDGSLIDCALFATLKALKSLKLPHHILNDDKVPLRVANSEKLDRPHLDFTALPVSTCYSIIEGNIILCDPTLEEENISQSTLVITIDALSGQICNIDKVGGPPITPEAFEKCIENSIQRSNELFILL